MLIDLTLLVTPELSKEAQANQDRSLIGHLGTHFDVMNKTFPLEYTRLEGVVFDVSSIRDRDVDLEDVDLSRVRAGMFVAFYTGWLEEAGYGSRHYFAQHPQLSHELIAELLKRKVSIIGIDAGGIRRSAEHKPADQLCADHGCFVIENLCSLRSLANAESFTVHTYPVNFTGVTGLPCRVVAEI